MLNSITTTRVADLSQLSELRKDWRESLSGPQDGMWEIFRDTADHWAFTAEDQVVGYACANEEYGLIQFYLVPEWRSERIAVLRQFLVQEGVSQGMMGTNNPVFMSAALELSQSVTIDTYLFTDTVEVVGEEKTGRFRAVQPEELEKMIGFYHNSIGAPVDWLRGYLGNHVERGEVFFLEGDDGIVGACEVRKSASNAAIADIGMVVSPNHRREGYGTFLLGKAKAIAREWGRAPICSCEKANVGSLRSIRKNGFRSTHQLLRVGF